MSAIFKAWSNSGKEHEAISKILKNMRLDISVWIYLCSLCSCLIVTIKEENYNSFNINSDDTYNEIWLSVVHVVTCLGFF